jgi:hypothetical protein
LLFAPAALACGGLVAPNGAVRLSRAATLVAWHDGVEHYMTSFTYQGDVSDLGWIVPLPVVPDKIEEGGAWTLQRLFNETHPIVFDRAAPAVQNAGLASAAQVVEQVRVEALNITVLRGTGQEVLNWCAANNFFVSDETRDHLLVYAHGSPVFMAAKYDTAAARARHQNSGDGAPVLMTLRVPHPWVPLEVLALDGQPVTADLYLLTDHPLYLSDAQATIGQSAVGQQLSGAPGFKLAVQEPMNDQLFHDLSTDRNMSWVWPSSWLTYLSLDANPDAVTYDLGVTSRGVIRLAPFGTAPMAIGGGVTAPSWLPLLPLGTPQVVIIIVLLLVVLGGVVLLCRAAVKAAPPTRRL